MRQVQRSGRQRSPEEQAAYAWQMGDMTIREGFQGIADRDVFNPAWAAIFAFQAALQRLGFRPSRSLGSPLRFIVDREKPANNQLPIFAIAFYFVVTAAD